MKHHYVWAWSLAAAATAASAFAASQPVKDYGKLPLTFEANAGQTDSRVRYLSRGSGYTLFLTGNNEAVLSLARTTKQGLRETTAVRMTMPGSKASKAIQALDPLSTVSNYLHGKDSKQWLTDVRHYGRIAYSGVYPGIDVVYYGNQRQVEYDFIVAPGADPRAIRLKFDGAQDIRTDVNGDLLLPTPYGTLRQLKPVVYQETNGQRRYVAANYIIRHGEVGFSLGQYDRSEKLVIDPILVYSTFLGGTGVENGQSIAVDGTGSAYVVGATASTDFPVLSGIPGQVTFRGGSFDAFVVKYAPAGNLITSATYIGGSGADTATSVAIDGNGDVLVGGNTDSVNFPLLGAVQQQIGGRTDAFLLKIRGSSLVYSTYLGGFEDENATGVAVDTTGNAVLVGSTRSTNFWAQGGLRPAYNGGVTDGWIFKMGPTGQRVWSTYLGGSSADGVNAVAIDAAGNVYVAGYTQSVGFPVTVGAFQSIISTPGFSDAFVSKIKADGTGFLYSTYLGGTAYDEGIDIAVDSLNNAYIVGDTDSVNFPTLGTLQGPPGNGDVFVTKLNATGSGLLFSTYLAGSGIDNASSLGLDAVGSAYVLGTTNSTNFPVVNPIQPLLRGGYDLFVAKIDAMGTARVWATYLGGLSDDIASGLAVDTNANVYVTGSTISTDFPQVLASQQTLRGAQDAFVSKIAGCDITLTPASATFMPASSGGTFLVNAANCPWVAGTNDPWITITSPVSGVNSASVTYTVSANAGTARTGTIVVGGIPFTITQSGLTTTPPTVVSLAPTTGSGDTQTFTARYTTANPGGAAIDRVYLLINTSVNGAGSCLAEYSPLTNNFRLINNDGGTWSGSSVAGSAVVLSNSQCSLNVATSSGSTAAGTGVLETTVNYAISFTGAFAGAKNTYLLANSEAAGLSSGWVQGGTWTIVPGGQPGGTVGVQSLTPPSGVGVGGTFTSVFTHTGGSNQHYLGYTLFLSTPNVVNYTATGSCLVEYNRISNGMRLINDAGTGWLGGESGFVLGTAQVLSNSYCTVNVQAATAVVAGTAMTVNIPITFQNSLGPVLGTFLQALDVNGTWTGMTQFGNWVIPGAPPVRTGPAIVSIVPLNTVGSSASYTITAAHPAGFAALEQVHLLTSDRIVGGSPCHVVYLRGANTLNLVNDAGTALVSPIGIAPGTAGFLSNSRCSVNTSGASVVPSGTTLAVTVPLSFNSATFAGSKNVYGIAFDNTGLTSHWVVGASLLVQ